MAGARSGDDRLPWLDAARPARRTRARARTPLLILLGLFLASVIAVMAFLSGRSTGPMATSAPSATAPVESVRPATVAAIDAPLPLPVPVPLPAPTELTAPSAPVVMTPVPAAKPLIGATPAKARATPARARRTATVRRSAKGNAMQRPAPAVVVHRNSEPAQVPLAPAAVPLRRTAWAARPFAGPRGRVIQLGAHLTQRKADASWWRLARAYPYLTTLPRMVIWYGPSPGRPRYYRVRLATRSNREAHALCRNLYRINRACTVV